MSDFLHPDPNSPLVDETDDELAEVDSGGAAPEGPTEEDLATEARAGTEADDGR